MKSEKLEGLKEKIKRLEHEKTKHERELKAPCSHTGKNGKLAVKFLEGKGNLCQCKICETVFSLKTYDKDDIAIAVEVVHDAINQIKVMTEDPKADESILTSLGKVDLKLLAIPKHYAATILKNGNPKKNKNGKKKHKNNQGNNNFYAYGVENLSLGSKKK